MPAGPMPRAIWLATSWLSIPLTLAAQFPARPDTTLDRLTREAVRGSAILLQQHGTAAASAMRVGAAGALPDPHLSLGVMDLTLPRFAFRESDFTEVDVELSQTFPWPGTLRARTRVAEGDARSAAAEASASQRTIAVSVARAYYRLRYVVTAERTVAQQRRLLRELTDLATARYATGSTGQSDPLQARVALARLDAEAESLQADAESARATLRALRGVRDRGERITVQPLEPADGRAMPREGGRTLADSLASGRTIEGHPLLLARHAAVSADEQRTRVEALASRPDFTVITRYGGRPLGVDFFSAFVAVRVPLWAGRKQRVLAEAMQLETEAARRALDADRDALTAELDRVLATARASRAQLDLLLDQVLPLTDEAAAAAIREYRTGGASFLQLLTAQDGQYRARLEAASMAALHLTSLVELEELLRPEVIS